PLRQIEMKMDRRGLRIRPGDNFRYLSEKYGIDREIIFRALWAKEGNLDKEEFIVSAIEDANFISQLVVVDEADRFGERLTPYILSAQNTNIVEAPYAMVQEAMYLIPLIGRRNGNETGYHLYMSTDGISYSKQASVSTFATAGSLTNELPYSEPVLDYENTLTIDFDYDLDAQNITTISRADMIAGKNLALMVSGGTQEIISFETITPDPLYVGRYAITDMYRGRYDTEVYSWPAGSRFYFFGTSPPLVQMAGLVKGNTRGFKYVYYNTLHVGDVSAATGFTYDVVGRAWTPKQPGGFRCNGTDENTAGGAVYTSAISLEWNPEIRGQGAGRQDPDVVIDFSPTWEGLFEILAMIGATVAFTDTAVDAFTTGYSNGQIKAWNGGTLPDTITFKLTNYILTDGVKYESPYNNLTVNKE
ncbi:MAG: hypothetical protein KAS39_00815, partial [Actinomycetia bacterium]|nr:hypothetical protein [Actinomycetes bacterium]